MTSPEVSIEPGRLIGAQLLSQLLPDTVLAESAHRKADGPTDRGPELVRQALQLLMRLTIDPHTRRLHANQHTRSLATLFARRRTGYRPTRSSRSLLK